MHVVQGDGAKSNQVSRQVAAATGDKRPGG
jgi:hypothetical protein